MGRGYYFDENRPTNGHSFRVIYNRTNTRPDSRSTAAGAKGKGNVEGAENDDLCMICQARPVDPGGPEFIH